MNVTDNDDYLTGENLLYLESLSSGRQSLNTSDGNGIDPDSSRSLIIELDHLQDKEKIQFLQELYAHLSSRTLSVREKEDSFRYLYSANTFEEFLSRRFPGKKRFSLEGSESLILAIEAAVEEAADSGVKQMLLGMAHRGRLNLLYHTMRKELSLIFAEFDERLPPGAHQGDVKYHQGYSANRTSRKGNAIHLSLASNPSHLEMVSAAVEGSVRGRMDRDDDTAGEKNMALLVHGDGAFSGQGINYELLNLSQLSGYSTGGTLHLILNNRVAFTTNPEDGRSTRYCTDLARMLPLPIFHVDGSQPEQVVRAIVMAMEWRKRYHTDVFVEIIAYRKNGHNETDDPMLTQPQLYKWIGQQKRTWEVYGEQLQNAGVSQQRLIEITREIDREFESRYAAFLSSSAPLHTGHAGGVWKEFSNNFSITDPTTALPLQQLKTLSEKIFAIPETFSSHATIQRTMAARLQAIKNEEAIDWGAAESLAYASLLSEGYSIRLSGQDSQRGTFGHRHAVIHDQANGATLIPLKSILNHSSRFHVINSPLNELASLGFEYGYSLVSPQNLVIWEAQFGDFVNGAQIIIDQFISSARVKWGRESGLVLYLPHGYEGMGPEHSSARIERFLQLCSGGNMDVVYPTTPAQMFHLLRRSMHRSYRRPLIIFTPKSLLRRKDAKSPLAEFSRTSSFTPILADATLEQLPGATESVQRIVVSTGKIYYDLQRFREEKKMYEIALIRMEGLYPFPEEELKKELLKYPYAKEIALVQDEPANQGALEYLLPRVSRLTSSSQRLIHFERKASPVPATGYHSIHQEEEKLLVESTLNLNEPDSDQQSTSRFIVQTKERR